VSEPIKHSPGPWKANGDHVVVDKDGNYVAGTYSLRVFEDVTPNNLRLIAAAPEMYRILRVILDNRHRDQGLLLSDAMASARLLVERLEGQQ
jgi:hypothetical protein